MILNLGSQKSVVLGFKTLFFHALNSRPYISFFRSLFKLAKSLVSTEKKNVVLEGRKAERQNQAVLFSFAITWTTAAAYSLLVSALWPLLPPAVLHTVECVCSKLLQSCLTFCDAINCRLPGSSGHWIFQAGVLEWVAMPSFRGSS